MVALWIMIILLCLLTATGGSLIALRIQRRTLDNSRQEREAWQQAQEGRQRTWEVRQGKHILDAEKKLADQLKETRREWRDWSIQVQEDHQEWRESVDLEKELARLPHIESMELAYQNERSRPKDWHPAPFYKANLRGHDLSHRYLERADLREAQLTNANLYMADLAGASLTGANLQQADLTGANLAGADLRGADLSGVNLLVADLHNAALHGTNLTGARNLTPAQLQSAIYDSTTIIESSIDITLPRIPGVMITPPELLATASSNNHAAPTSSEETIISAISEPLADTPPSLPTIQEVASSPEASADAALLTPASETVLATTSANPVAVPQAEESPDTSTPVSEKTEESPDTSILASEKVEESPDTSTPVSEKAEESPDTSILASEKAETGQESNNSTGETDKKSNTSKKRANKARAATPSLPTLNTKQEETGAHQANESSLSGNHEEMGEFDEEKLLSNKIIQLQDHTAKMKAIGSSGEPNKDDPAQKKRGNNRSANFTNTTPDPKNQRAHAN